MAREDEVRDNVERPTLEGDIESLRKLAEHRENARKWRDRLAATLIAGQRRYLAWRKDEERKFDLKRDRQLGKWDAPGDIVEVALVGTAMQIDRRGNPESTVSSKDLNALHSGLNPLDIQSLFERHPLPRSPEDDSVPLLRAAWSLHYLATTPGEALSFRAQSCYYRIVYELYSSTYPDWTTGGASASDDAESTAFITNESVRAVLALKSVLLRTAAVMKRMCLYADELRRSHVADEFQPLRDRQRRQVARATLVEIMNVEGRILFDLPKLGDAGLGSDAEVDRWFEDVPQRLLETLQRYYVGTKPAIEHVQATIDRRMKLVHRDERRKRLVHGNQTWDAWLRVYDVCGRVQEQLDQARNCLGSARSKFDRPRKFVDCDWEGLCDVMTREAKGIEKLLRPTERYLASVLNRELAAEAGVNTHGADIPEMICAAIGWGSLTGRWDDPRLRVAIEHATRELNHRGEFRKGRPFQVGPKGYALHPASLEITRAYCRLVGRVGVPVEAETVRRLLARFDALQLALPDDHVGLRAEGSGYPTRASWWTTSLGVQAANAIILTLDVLINRGLEQHFTVRRPERSLHEMLPSDVGLSESRAGGPMREPLLDTLNRCLVHALGLRRSAVPFKSWRGEEPLWSLVLHGPPGTGKTSIVEALAASAGQPLFVITPSDIIMKGSEEAEARARLVFEALPMLTDAVILFDEFDVVLKSREATKGQDGSMFGFLTPGMLPKLQTLYRNARRNRVCYVLATNRVKDLDEAAIREGRFDRKVGVYPPDVAARASAFIRAAESRKVKHGPPVFEPISWDARRKRILLTILMSTAMAPVSRLVLPGWCAPADERQKDANVPARAVQTGRLDRLPSTWPKSEVIRVPEWSREQVFAEAGTLGVDGQPDTPRSFELCEMRLLHQMEEHIEKVAGSVSLTAKSLLNPKLRGAAGN